MKDQIVTPRNSGRTGAATRSRNSATVNQRPIRRERGSGPREKAGSLSLLKKVVGWLPTAVKVGVAVALGVLIFAGYKAAASASFFQVRAVDVSGVSRTSPEEIKSIVKRLTNSTGVWRADLDQMSKELGHLTWVRTAVVSRVLPDGLRVRITERTPRAVARLSTGRFIWVDEEGAGLGEVKPSDQMPDFFVRGWNEAGGEEAQVENRKRIQRFLEMSNDFAAAGLGSRLSEIDVNDLVDVRAQLTGDDADIAIWLGKEDFANRLRRALKTLDERKNTAQGAFITHIDVSQGTRAVVGFDRDVRKLPVNDDSGSSTQTQEVANSNTVSKTSARLPAFSSKRSQDPSTLKRSDHAQVVKIAASPKTSKTSNQGKIDRR